MIIASESRYSDNGQMRIHILIISLLVFCWSLTSQASLFLEPYVGLSKFEQKQEDSAGFVTKDTANWFHLGVRGGYFFGKRWFVGGEYFRGGPYTFKDLSFGTTETENSTSFLGGIVGGDFDIIRVSASYFPSHDMTTAGTSTVVSGTAFRVGLSLKVGQKIRANFDVFIQTLNKQTAADGTETELDPIIEGETAAVSVSFPFQFN